MGVGGQRHAPAALPPGKLPGTHCIRSWVWTGAENLLPPTGIRLPERQAGCKSICRLSYPGPRMTNITCFNNLPYDFYLFWIPFYIFVCVKLQSQVRLR